MKVPLSLLLCFPVLSLSIALPPYETLDYYYAVYSLVTVNLFMYDRETSPIGVKALFARVSGGECKAEVPEYFEEEIAGGLFILTDSMSWLEHRVLTALNSSPVELLQWTVL